MTTRQEYTRWAQLLRDARRIMWDGVGSKPRNRCRRICNAISVVGGRGVAGARVAYSSVLLRREVKSRLGKPNFDFDSWLIARGIIPTQPQLQRHRIAWIDRMIAEFEEAAN